MAENGQYVAGSLYFYDPNQGAAIFFAVVFGLSMIAHYWQCIAYRSFKVTALYPFCCFLFTVGFAMRAFGATHYTSLGPFLAQLILIYAAPPLLELANYHVLGRVLYYVPYCSPIHPGRTLTTFGSLSVIVEVLNGLGVAWAYDPVAESSLQTVGAALLKASLILQIVVIFLFIALAATFQSRCAQAGVAPRGVRAPLLTMYLSAFLILIRCIFRTVQIFLPSGSTLSTIDPIDRYEWYFYVFETVPMFLDCLLWNVRHPRRYLPEKYTVFIERDGVTEIEGTGWNDSRPFIVTVCDPFGFFARDRKPSQ